MSYETTTDETNIDDTNSVNANIERIRSSFEDVWPLVISHELVHTLVNSIIKTMKRIGIAENNTYADPDPVDGGEIEGLFFYTLLLKVRKIPMSAASLIYSSYRMKIWMHLLIMIITTNTTLPDLCVYWQREWFENTFQIQV